MSQYTMAKELIRRRCIMEVLDIVDERGEPTGRTVERSRAHAEGILHRTAHVWILRKRNGIIQILLQKRSDNKDSHPGVYDISSAGHIPAGVDYISSAVRELKEELGVSVKPDALMKCGQRRIHYDEIFHGKRFIDNQVSNVYILWLDREPEGFVLQTDEVSEVRWFALEECIRLVESGQLPNCIVMEELLMVEQGSRTLSLQ
ncbi:MAG: NUDIX domain-containing protein [Lachnospiraceae bacterium]